MSNYLSLLDWLERPIQKGVQLLLSHQCDEGYWWYTLEANESINAEYILLLHYLGIRDRSSEQALVRRIESSQKQK